MKLIIMDKSKDYKKTLLMPKTDFEMRGNLVQKDPNFLKFWNKENIYEFVSTREIKKREEEFILHDGPPYANGNIHVGHALNKILKDIFVKREILKGKKVSFIPGWDTHGLPIELEVQKSGIKLQEVGKKEYLKACFKYAYKQVENQEKQFKRMGIFADFDNKYLTLKKEFEVGEIQIFNKMFEEGLVYQDLKPVYWSWSSNTALADAEIEYTNLEDNSIYVKFKIENEDLNLLVWTTTPWTLSGNVAIAFGEKEEYKVVEHNNEKYVVASNLVEDIEKKVSVNFKVVSNFEPKNFIGKKALNPLNGNKSRILYGHHVTTESGTGIVHIAGGHGLDDYQIVKENDLKLFIVMDDNGLLINSGEFNGVFYIKANDLIINSLKEKNTLFYNEKFVHSVPIDWRTKKPVVYRATKQWFFSVESIKGELIENIKNVKWLPSWGEKRLTEMTEKRSDWCISRQRLWGVPIPVIYDEKGNPIDNKELRNNIEKLFEEKGMLGWHSTSIEELLPNSIKYNDKMRKETDILDVWFDSGSSNYSVLKEKQADIFLEGTDQYRGWFNSSLITSTVMKGEAPYKKVITHGFVTDGEGMKMSKSKGNVVSPLDILDKNGIDILRLWVASTDYTNNVKISNDIIEQVSNDYRKIRNTIKFILGSISDYENNNKNLIENHLNPNGREWTLMSKAILSNISKLYKEIEINYNNGSFIQVLKLIMNEIGSGSFSYYLEYSKDVVYIEKEDSNIRREVQFVLGEILILLLITLAPIIPVTIEEAFQSLVKSKESSIFKMNKVGIRFFGHETWDENNYWEQFSEIRNLVNKEIENQRNEKVIKRSFELEVNLPINVNNSWYNEELEDYLLVGKVNKVSYSKNISSKVFEGTKCERCWKIFSKDKINGEICNRCKKIIEN